MTQADTIGSKLRHYVETQPDKPAIVASGFAPITYRQLGKQISDVQAELRRAGLNRDAKVLVALQNGPLAAFAIVAVTCSATSIPLDPRLTYAEVEKRMATQRPDAVLLLKGMDSPARRVAGLLKIAILELSQTKDGLLGFDLHRSGGGDIPPPTLDQDDPDSIAFILGTSGTTSASKLVPTSHRNMIAAAARVKMWFGLTPNDRCLNASPVFYAHGLHVTVFCALLNGGSVAFPKDATKFNEQEWFGQLQPTWYSAGPTLHRLIVDQISSNDGTRLDHSLRFIVSGGAPLPQKTQDGLRRAFEVPVLEHYGSTECMQICSNQVAPGRSKPGTCGLPCPDTIRIVDGEGRQVPAGVRGEIIISGPTVTSGYLNAPELNRAYFTDGWFRSGDIGSIDDEGFLSLHGRKDDLINRGGEKIAPAEVEFELLRHPAIAEAAVFSVPHPRLGEGVSAAVMLQSGASVTASELRGYLRSRLVSFKVPQRIHILEALPKGSTGKVLRTALREFDLRQTRAHVQSQDATEMLIAEIWQRLLQTDEIGIEEEFFEAGGDSLLAEQMLLEIEALINRPIPPSALSEGLTIQRLAVIAKAGLDSSRESELVTKLRDAPGTPFFYCHGDFTGRGLYALKLAELIDPPRPVFLIHALRRIPEMSEGLTIEEMARLYVPSLLATQPDGAFRLGGHCNGGLLAYEIASQLRKLGRQVELVLMIDSFSINCLWPARLARSMIAALSAIVPAGQFREKLVQKGMISVWYRFGRLCVALAGLGPIWPLAAVFERVAQPVADEPSIINSPGLADIYLRAMANYIPPKLESTVVAIISDEEAGNPLILPQAWKSRASTVKQRKVPGTHLGCITVEVKALAENVGSALEECNAQS